MTRPSTPSVTCYLAIVTLAFALIWGNSIRTDRQSKTSAVSSAAGNNSFKPSVKSVGKPEIAQSYGKLPLAFEVNQGQTDRRVKFLSRANGYTLFLTSKEAVLSLKKSSQQSSGSQHAAGLQHSSYETTSSPSHEAVALEYIRMKLLGADPEAAVSGTDELPGKLNYFLGNDPSKWRTNVPTYAKVKYHHVYPGVDLIYYGNQSKLEYDFVVAPGADPRTIRLGFAGNEKISTNGDGALVLQMKCGNVSFERPLVYQEAGTWRESVEGRYVSLADGSIGFEVANYDRTRPLVIDPVLIYSTYLGGSDVDVGRGIAVDSHGSAYIAGITASTNFPTANPYQPTFAGGSQFGVFRSGDAFITKISPSGALVYSTYLGGSDADGAFSVAVDSTGSAYVAGLTGSSDFPTVNAFQTKKAGGLSNATDNFITKLSPDGSKLAYSTYLGNATFNLYDGFFPMIGIAVDSVGSVYLAGATQGVNFPTVNALQSKYGGGLSNAFVTKINSSGSSLVYSTYLGGSDFDWANGIAVDSQGNAYVTGQAESSDFPTVNALQPSSGGGFDAFITKINAGGSGIVYSTYLGGSGTDGGIGIAVDSAQNAYVTGFSASSNFPLVHALQPHFGGSPPVPDGFVAKVNAGGSALVYSTYLSCLINTMTYGFAIAVDSVGNAFVTGEGCPIQVTANALQPTSSSTFVDVFNASGSSLIYGSFLGGNKPPGSSNWGYGIAVDSAANVYVTGGTSSTDFPTVNPIQSSFGGGSNSLLLGDAFIAKFSVGPVASLSPANLAFGSQVVGTTTSPQTIMLSNEGISALNIVSIGIAGTNSSDFSQTNTCGPRVAAGTSCTINVTFAPTASGARSASVNIADDAPGTPQAVAVSGTGTAPAVGLSPAKVTFGNQLVGTTSGPQSVTLNNTGTGALSISSIGIMGANSGDFSETDTCGSSVAAGANCTISVTFKPATGGTPNGTLSITDNANGSPQTLSLSGNATDFSLGPAPGSATSSTFTAGQSATLNLQVNAVSGFTGAVNLACAGAPAQSTCTPSASSVSITGASSAPFSVTVTTTARGLLPPRPLRRTRPRTPQSPPPYTILVLMCVLAAALKAAARTKLQLQRTLVTATVMTLCFATILSASGCGGGGSSSPPPPTGTPAGTYNLTVTGTSQGQNRTVTLVLTVN
jgi:hypothetical protein